MHQTKSLNTAQMANLGLPGRTVSTLTNNVLKIRIRTLNYFIGLVLKRTKGLTFFRDVFHQYLTPKNKG